MFDSESIALYVTVAFGISEALSLIPQIKANGIFQMFLMILGTLSKKKN